MFRWLLDASAFMPRSYCGDWTPGLVSAYVAGNALVAVSYYAIPATLLTLWWRRRSVGKLSSVPLRYQRVLSWFALFIVLCGTTHVCDVLVFWWPAYRFFTVVTDATGLVSAYVACRLPWVLRDDWNMVPVELVYAALDTAETARVEAEIARVEAEQRFKKIIHQAEALHAIAWNESAHERLARLETLLAVAKSPRPEAAP